MSLAQKYNQRAMEVWGTFGATQPRMPILLPELNEHPELLVVGMNPSFNTEWVDNQLVNETELRLAGGPWTADSLFRWDASARSRMSQVIEFERFAKTAYAGYFAPVERFVSAVGCTGKWEHLDLFLMRETSQKAALEMVLGKTRPIGELNDFGRAQLELFIETLIDLQPKAVLVANAAAAALAKQLLGPSHQVGEPAALEFDALPNTRFFFSGMLSGQRCMDNFSLERLVYQVRAYVQQLSGPVTLVT